MNDATASKTSSNDTSLNEASSGTSETGRLVGYARVFTDDQNLTLQVDALTRHGITKSDIFMDKLSGAKRERPGLTKCLDTLQSGDILVVWRYWIVWDGPCVTLSRWWKIFENGE